MRLEQCPFAVNKSQCGGKVDEEAPEELLQHISGKKPVPEPVRPDGLRGCPDVGHGKGPLGSGGVEPGNSSPDVPHYGETPRFHFMPGFLCPGQGGPSCGGCRPTFPDGDIEGYGQKCLRTVPPRKLRGKTVTRPEVCIVLGPGTRRAISRLSPLPLRESAVPGSPPAALARTSRKRKWAQGAGKGPQGRKAPSGLVAFLIRARHSSFSKEPAAASCGRRKTSSPSRGDPSREETPLLSSLRGAA